MDHRAPYQAVGRIGLLFWNSLMPQSYASPELNPSRGQQLKLMSSKQDRYLAVVWNDEYSVPTGQVATYFVEVSGDREGVLDLFSNKPAFQLLGDFSNAETARALVEEKIRELASTIPPEVRAKWPSIEDRQYVETCSICGFTYCPRLPKDAQQHSRRHRRFSCPQ